MIEQWLATLGIGKICQWDVLVFLHRHRTAILSAEHIAVLMRYETGMVVTALDHLESLGMVGRSRLSHGVRLYQLTSLHGPRGRAFTELLALMQTRAGRLEIIEDLQETGPMKLVSSACAMESDMESGPSD